MNFGNPTVLAIIGVIAVIVGIWVAQHYFSADAKLERRRRRNNRPAASKINQPMVKLSVRTKKERRK